MRMSKSDLLAWLADLPNQQERRFIVVQHMSGWRTPATEWSRYFAGCYSLTGKYPGGMGSDWGHGQSSSDLLDWADILADYWDTAGIITVEAHLRNPWSGGDAWDQTGRNLADLYNPASAVYPTWTAMLDVLAVGFQELEDRGAVVLFRPWHEMTYANCFWWSSVGYESDFKLAWQHMHDYLETTKGLSNLLWVFSAADQGTWHPAIDAYPGDSYVDLVGCDIYGSSTTIGGTDYEDLTGTGKPFCFGELGGNYSASFDNHNIINTVRSNYPLAVYGMWWHDWNAPDYPNRASLVGCLGAHKTLYDYWTRSRSLGKGPTYLCYITHEVGDLSEYDSTENPDGDMTISANAALVDTDYGLDILIDDTTPIYARANYSTSNKLIRARFHIDPNGMSFPSNLDNFVIFCFHRSSGPPWCIGFVEFGIDSGTHWLRAVANFDDGVTTVATNRISMSDAPHRCEVWVACSSSALAGDGYIAIRVDDTVAVARNVDNYDIWDSQDGCTIGAIWGIESGTSGRLFLDELAVIDAEIEIGASTTATMSMPDGDMTSEWDSTEIDHHDAVNLGWQQPGTAGESSYIDTTDALATYTESFTMDSPAVAQYITEVVVWALCHVTDSGVSKLDVSLWNSDESSQYGSTQTVDETPDSTTIDIPIYLPNDEGLWRSVTFSGLSLSPAQFAGMVVRLEGRMCSGCPSVQVYGLYALHTLSGLTTSTSTSTSTTSTLTSTTTSITTTSSSTSTSTTVTLTTTSTSTSTTSTVTTTSTTTTLGLTGGMCWGEENPTQGEEAASWQLWTDGAAGVPTIDGDADWGKLDLDMGEEGRGPVCDFGNANPRRYIVTENRYGAGRESATLQIRGSAAAFAQDDALPNWENYTVPIVRSWQYVQVREDR